MKQNFEAALALVLKHEGGFVNHPRDPGGATNRGVTLKTFRALIDPRASVADLKAITDAQLKTVYKTYWDAVRGDELQSGLDYAMFDFAVNSGPNRAILTLQRVLDVPTVDGNFGPNTLKSVRAVLNPVAAIKRLNEARLRFLNGLETWSTFGKGWSRRVEGVTVEATKMAGIPVLGPTPTPRKDGLLVRLLSLVMKLLSNVR